MLNTIKRLIHTITHHNKPTTTHITVTPTNPNTTPEEIAYALHKATTTNN
ncbi:hypothetical protein VVR12_01655 [Rothia sp. LK2588]